MATLDFMMSRRMQRILGALLLHPQSSFSLADLIRLGGDGRGATQKVVSSLYGSGVVTDRRAGNQRLFTINAAHPLYAELRSISLKTFGLTDRIRDALASIADKIELAFVFGSMANGQDRAASDIDLMVVGDADLFEVGAVLSVAESSLGRSIHLTLLGAKEWQDWKSSPVGARIASGPRIMVIGNEPGRTHQEFEG